MNKRIIALMACAFALCLALVGCAGGGGGGGAAKPDNDKNFVGIWEAESMKSGSETVSKEDMELMRSLDLNVTMEFKEDKALSFNMMGWVMEGTWEAKDANTVALTLEGDTVDGKLADGKLTVEVEDAEMVFVLNNDAKITKPGSDSDSSSGLLGGLDSGSSSSGSSSSGSSSDKETPINEVIVDDDNVTIEVLSMGVDFGDDPGYNLKVTNKTDKTIYVTADWGSFSVDGKMLDPFFGETVKPGKYTEAFMYFDKEKLGGGTEKLVAVEGVIVVRDDDSYDTIAEYDFLL